jgi:hypothetical protein
MGDFFMASLLPFNNAVIGGVTVAAAEFVNGTGKLTETGKDKAVTTADGRIHNIRQYLTAEATFECFGDKTSLASGLGAGVTCALKNGEAAVRSFDGVVTAVYNDSKKTTAVTVSGR